MQKEKLVIIKTNQQLRKLIDYIKDKEIVAFDFETTGLTRDDKAIGFSIAVNNHTGIYVILSYWDPIQKKLIDLETTQLAKEFMISLCGKKLIMANACFDCMVAEVNYGVKLMPYVWIDIIPLGHLLNENRKNGLKERGQELFGDDAIIEQQEMSESVLKNGGRWAKYEKDIYMGDMHLIAKYGAKDAILTWKVMEHDLPILFEEGLDKFFFEEETMPLLRGPTYDMNMAGLRIDPDKLQKLRGELEAECMEQKAFILKEIEPIVKAKYPGTGKTNHFNINATQQLSWLLFEKLGNEFGLLTDGGKEVCHALEIKIPYAPKDKAIFIHTVKESKNRTYITLDSPKPKKIRDWWTYCACDEEELSKLAPKYRWVETLLAYKKNTKLLSTYVRGIQDRTRYNIVYPSFLQHGTTSGRYSSKNPNFQNLPRDDKRVKSCIISRPGKVLVGADYEQLEPRIFASISEDSRLQNCFKTGDDVYSLVGMETFEKYGLSLKKNDENSFAKKWPKLRQIAKEEVMLASTYGTTPFNMARNTGLPVERCREIIESYFNKFPSVFKMMLESHEQVKSQGKVFSLFGRPRRMPEGLKIRKIYGDTEHSELPYAVRNTLNLAMNHRIQSTAASIMNRAAIMCWNMIRELETSDNLWSEVKIVMQVHDELILEGPAQLAENMASILRISMQEASKLPGVDLIAIPKIANNLADLK